VAFTKRRKTVRSIKKEELSKPGNFNGLFKVSLYLFLNIQNHLISMCEPGLKLLIITLFSLTGIDTFTDYYPEVDLKANEILINDMINAGGMIT